MPDWMGKDYVCEMRHSEHTSMFWEFEGILSKDPRGPEATYYALAPERETLQARIVWRDTAAWMLRNKIQRQIPTESEMMPINRIRAHVNGDVKILEDSVPVKGSLADVAVMGAIACCPPAWPFAIMSAVFGKLSGEKKQRR